MLRLGGEGKNATISQVSFDLNLDVEKPTGKRFKLYFQTPTFFSSGDGLSELSALKGLTLLSASIGRPMPIGGFDMAETRPKPMRKAVPPGSIYYFEGNDLAAARLEISALFDPEDSAKGFNVLKLINC